MSERASLLERSRGVILGVSSESSVGYACAAAFRALGGTVGITHRPGSAEGARLAAQLGCPHAALEATDEGSIGQAIDELGNHLGRIDFLIHTLVHVPEGVLDRPLHELSARHFADVLEIGVRSLLVACRHALPFWRRSPHPRLVALTSSGGALAIPGYHALGIAKAALESAVRYLALELGPEGILCNSVSFSAVETAGARRAIGVERLGQTRAHLARRSLTRRPVELEHVTSALAFFASPACQNITGELVTVDGGFSRSYF
jgi:enoyl-[acyl-carrier protein] reductase I